MSRPQFSSRGFQRHRHHLTCGATLGVRGGRNNGLTAAPRICWVAKLTDNIAQRRHDSCWDGSFWHCSCSACYSAETCLPRHPGTSDRIPLRFDVSPACGKSFRCTNESTGPYVSMGCRGTRWRRHRRIQQTPIRTRHAVDDGSGTAAASIVAFVRRTRSLPTEPLVFSIRLI